ncbi:hypothetical protein HanLR1_Chr17g0677601 [Helianthus annuus]|nr:hypothetical protein HanHA89_Chr17g0719141 [Helianthus annuus]KAJ0633504.1 hypothetical protein HanLR1_Chr17g0677601 [Helianthus annuus]
MTLLQKVVEALVGELHMGARSKSPNQVTEPIKLRLYLHQTPRKELIHNHINHF